VQRALAVLTAGAFVTLVIEGSGSPAWLAQVALAAVYAGIATVGFAWVDRQLPRRRRFAAVGYVLVQLALGYLLFGFLASGVGAILLFMVLVSQGVLLLPLPAAVVLAAAVPLVHIGMNLGDGLREATGTLAASAFTLVVSALLVREERARAELDEANARLRDYAAQVERLATVQERNRLARDIHDGLGHHLTVVSMQVQAARAVLAADPARADAVLAKAQAQSAEALAEVRRSVAALREPRSAPPLPDALAVLAADTSAAGVPTEVEVSGTVRPMPSAAEESLFRSAQEALTNVRKHARATTARVLLDYRDPGSVRLEVRDDGTGMADGAASGAGFGLVGVRERAAGVGGRVAVESVPGRGLTLRVEVPG
jgi:signal transduction histidine kinase